MRRSAATRPRPSCSSGRGPAVAGWSGSLGGLAASPPRGAGRIRIESMPVVDDWPRDAAQVRRWDFAASEARPGADPDYTAGVRVAWKDGRCWVVDVKRERLTPRGVELLVRATAEQDGTCVPVLL